MDTVYISQLERLFMQAAPYRGNTWRKAVASSLEHIASEFQSLSKLAADNLELAVNAESCCNGLRDEVARLKAEFGNAVTAEEPVAIMVVEPVVVETTESTITMLDSINEPLDAHDGSMRQTNDHEGRCTVQSCNALGIKIHTDSNGKEVTPETFSDAYLFAKESGLEVSLFGLRSRDMDGEDVDSDSYFVGGKCSVKEFIQTHPEGRFMISTRGHAMAIVDGKLTDTTNKGPDGRKVIAAFEVRDRKEE
jgi:hypothetical protein